MKKILEALKGLLPADQLQEVSKAVEEMLGEAKSELEAEFNAKLKDAYEKVTEQLEAAEATKETGYKEAYTIIDDLTKRLDTQREEYEAKMEEGFEEAYQMLQTEQEKNKNLEAEIYEEFNGKIKQMRDLMVDKMDEYLHTHNAEIYESARRDLLSDPRMVEHKVALNKIMDVLSHYVSEEDFGNVASNRIEEASKSISDLKSQVQVLEARNVRLSTQNTKLNEQVREMNNVLTESTKTERKERTKVAESASGRGQRVLDSGEKVIAEFANPKLTKAEEDSQLNEGEDEMRELLVLSGLVRD
jgi:regulator of replication initiation timing